MKRLVDTLQYSLKSQLVQLKSKKYLQELGFIFIAILIFRP